MDQRSCLYLLSAFMILGSTYGVLDFTGSIEIEKLELCKGSPNPYNVKVALKENPRYAVVSADIKKDVDNNVKINVKIERNNAGTWKKAMEARDSICKMASNFAPKAWTQFAKATKPNLPTPCGKIKAGKYAIDKLQFSSSEFRVPLSWIGKYRATVTIANKAEELFCLYGEINLSK